MYSSVPRVVPVL